ncbi:MAG: putative DNA modification/repair radical SAM protein [Eubacterium sp.]
MELLEKLRILTDAAKFDVACTSSGVTRKGKKGALGNTVSAGICHSFASDGRCISLLKVLMTNICTYDCQYCVNRCSKDVERAIFKPRELADLTIGFYRRNYIEGLFLSSAVVKNPDYTCEKMIEILALLRGDEYNFNGYIHVKAIPGADDRLLTQMGYLADRMSVNIELPSEESLKKLAPDKTKASIFKPMKLITHKIEENSHELVRYKHVPQFAPAGQSTQMIIGATPDNDYKILNLTEGLYKKYALKRVFFSAYIPVAENKLLPALNTKPPLLREHRLYQADWLLRFYGFSANELLDAENPNFNPLVDPKCSWALSHMETFPIEINKASKAMLLRVPGIGVKSAMRIVKARRTGTLDFSGLKKMGVVLKRAQYFILCNGKMMEGLKVTPDGVLRALISEQGQKSMVEKKYEQLTFFDQNQFPVLHKEVMKCLTQ